MFSKLSFQGFNHCIDIVYASSLRYNGKSVAIKRFLTLPEAERIYEKLECGVSRRSSPPVITNVEALQLFKDVRQEVTVLSCLDSPFVVKLLGVCLDPLFMATELAPQGSLFGLLEKRREVIQTQQGETAVSQIPKMPGGVLGYEITARISIQVCTMHVISVCTVYTVNIR